MLGVAAPGKTERETAMPKQYETEPLAIGAIVRIRNSGFGPGRIVEFRGPLGPNGARVYRVQLRKRPRPSYTEVLEEQLELESAETARAAGN